MPPWDKYAASEPAGPWGKYAPQTDTPDAPASLADIALGTPVGSILLGASDLVTGPAQLGANIGSKLSRMLPGDNGEYDVGQWANDKMAALNAASERGRAAQGRTGFDAWRMAGGLGAGTAASLASPMITRGLPYATSYLGKVAQGMGLGAFFGGTSADQSTTPQSQEDYLAGQGDKSKTGAVVGTAIPAVVSPILKAAYNVAEPYLAGGINTMASKTLNQAAGMRQPEIVKELLKNHPMNTLAGEAAAPAGSAEFSALQKMVAQRSPSDYSDISSQAQQARVNAVKNFIGKTPQKLESAQALRDATADVTYGKAFQGVVKPDATFNELIQRPSMEKAMRRGDELAQERNQLFQIGKNVPEQTVTSPIVSASGQPIQTTIPAKQASYPVQSLHWTKKGLDDLLSTSNKPGGLDPSESAAVAGTKKEFVKWLSQKSKDYGTARSLYELQSDPINKMQYGQALQQTLEKPLEVGEGAVPFIKARQDATRTIKNSMGMPLFEKESEFLAPSQISVLNKVEDQLLRNARYEDLAKRGAPAVGNLVKDNLEPAHVPNFFMRSVMIAHHILDRMQGAAETKTLNHLSKVMQNPQTTAQLMQSANPEQQAVIKALLERGGTVGASIGAPRVMAGGSQ